LVGNCYYLASIAALAEWPERIQNVFVTKEVNKAGCYVLSLYICGEKINLVLDDYIPCTDWDQKPAFTRTKQREIWV